MWQNIHLGLLLLSLSLFSQVVCQDEQIGFQPNYRRLNKKKEKTETCSTLHDGSILLMFLYYIYNI